MPSKKRFLPRQITRFNYWEFDIASPRLPHQLKVAVQRLGDFPEERWTDKKPGQSAAHRHIQQTFYLLLNATPEVWDTKIRPWLHKPVSAIRNRSYFALQFYIENDKEWYRDKIAQKVKKGLSPSHRTAIDRLDRKKWPPRSKRPEDQLKRTWTRLLGEIASDINQFERFIDNPPRADQMIESNKWIYRCYRNQAIKLLGGGGTYIPPAQRHFYQMPNPLDDSEHPKHSTCLNRNGRIESASHYEVNWLDLTTKDGKQNALRLTLHWFHHALRNLREYRYKRPPIPWTQECETACRRIQEKLVSRPPHHP